jgi:hypothetical protein
LTPLPFPDGRRFAFTIIDDTDVATVENVAPVYDLLARCGLRTTKTVWAFDWHGAPSDFAGSDTLDSAEYVAFVRSLQARGFEMASHGATMESSERAVTLRALERMRVCLGSVPRVHANHSNNRENLYWGVDRLDDPVLRALYTRGLGLPADHFQGHVPGSPYWWGDASATHHEYGRNLTFDLLDVRQVNPTMPYRDPRRPQVRWWFSAADANDADEFVRLCTVPRLRELEEAGGVCIVATHLGKGYTRDGRVRDDVCRVFEYLRARPGWYVPVGTLLDWLRTVRPGGETLPAGEWRRMQWRWAWGLVRRRLAERRSPLRQ